ncbi:hypothetical protein [Streptomyces lushanensis]|uniref:hypothetical protein n=1 Tax=Streptomyces lushanensis TaxID=1434255 RepID=UPI0008317013|nr:hypothetical protein [Streptomyces lushanensis]
MARTQRRKTVLAALALVAATALLTACQQDTSGATGTGNGTGTSADASAPAEPAGATSPSPEAVTSAPAEADTDADPDSGAPGDGKAQDGGTDGNVPSNGKGEGVTGTWFGNVSYLAPGKYTVSDMKGVEQAFWLAVDTDIQGTGDICGTDDPNAQAATPCTEAELEAAAKKGVSAEVTLKNGIAVRIVDDH